MKIIQREKIYKFMKKQAGARPALESWVSETEDANWKTPQDIKNRHGSADFLPKDRVIFNIKGNNYRLVVRVRYQNGIVVIEWVGTHADYDKERF